MIPQLTPSFFKLISSRSSIDDLSPIARLQESACRRRPIHGEASHPLLVTMHILTLVAVDPSDHSIVPTSTIVEWNASLFSQIAEVPRKRKVPNPGHALPVVMDNARLSTGLLTPAPSLK
jgi:hypothetical protein